MTPWPALLLLLSTPLSAAPSATLRGRVFEKGSIITLPGARLRCGTAHATTDARGQFELHLPVGKSEVLVTDPLHESIRVVETLAPGQTRQVEYLLPPLPADRRPFTVRVRGETNRGESFSLRDDELRTLPGSLGDPFRAIGLLPGVATPLPLLPLYVIRGASPGQNGFFLDGMRVPELFHLLVGGGVVHARLVDKLDFYPSAYGVAFGHYAGGIIDASTRGARGDGQHGEVELRVYDASAVVELSLPKDVRLTLSGHYGYPGPIIHAIDNRVDVSYWDYQMRLDWHGLTVEALGAFDNVMLDLTTGTSRGNGVPTQFGTTFHRLQVRQQGQLGRLSYEGAVVGGLDDSTALGGAGVRKYSLSFRGSALYRFQHTRFFAGFDAEVSRFTGAHFDDTATVVTDANGRPVNAGAAPDEFGELAGDRDGVIAGAFVQGTHDILPGLWSVTLGVRADVYHAGAVTLLGVDPRLQMRLTPLPWLTLNLGVGQYQQPPTFPVPLPGIDTYALQLGLQRARHGAVGIETLLPQHLSFSVTGYYQHYDNSNDIVLDFGPLLCTTPPPPSLTGVPALITRQVAGQAYGLELLLRRQAGRVTGWIAYTLSRSERFFSCGLRPSDFDQSHLLNVVVQVRLPWRMVAGARLLYQSGRPYTQVQLPDVTQSVRNDSRFPDYVQLDLRVDREWLFKRFALAVFLEVVNATYSDVVFGIQYPRVNGVTRYDQPGVIDFRWILPSIGVRGRF